MTRSLMLTLALALCTAAGSMGCSGSVGGEPTAVATASPETAATRAPIGQSLHGPLRFFADALGDLPLTATQRAAVEKLGSDAEARHAAPRAAHAELLVALAAQLEAGSIDRAALQPKVDALVASLRAVQPADRAALEQLHALLTPDQRKAFVDALQARAGARMRDARGRRPLEQWAADLQLTDDQKAQIRDAMKQRRAADRAGDEGAGHAMADHAEHGAKVLSAFTQERFVMDEVAPPGDLAPRTQHTTAHILGIAEAALPVLTPAQRALAAQKLRDRAGSADAETPILQ